LPNFPTPYVASVRLDIPLLLGSNLIEFCSQALKFDAFKAPNLSRLEGGTLGILRRLTNVYNGYIERVENQIESTAKENCRNDASGKNKKNNY